MHRLGRRSTLPTSTPIPTEQTRSAIRGHILFAFAVLLALALAWRLREVLALIYVSALFAVVLMPAVNRIMSFQFRGALPSRALSPSCFCSAPSFSPSSLFFLVALPPVIRNLHQFATDLPSRIPAIVARLKRLPARRQARRR